MKSGTTNYTIRVDHRLYALKQLYDKVCLENKQVMKRYGEVYAFILTLKKLNYTNAEIAEYLGIDAAGLGRRLTRYMRNGGLS